MSAEWIRPISMPPCPANHQIHIWSVDLHPPATVVDELHTRLAPDEAERAERFRFEKHRRRFIVRRGVLRSLLGAYLQRDPAELSFEEGPKGKPSLSRASLGEPPAERLRFNLSDSEELALIAVGSDHELGVDVESLERASDLEDIAERFFSSAEQRDLSALPAPEKTAGFFRAWTRKEAYLKAIGTGLSTPLDACTVTVGPDEPARFVHIEGQEGEAERWSLHHLDPRPGYLGALAIRRHHNQLRKLRWPASRAFTLGRI